MSPCLILALGCAFCGFSFSSSSKCFGMCEFASAEANVANWATQLFTRYAAHTLFTSIVYFVKIFEQLTHAKRLLTCYRTSNLMQAARCFTFALLQRTINHFLSQNLSFYFRRHLLSHWSWIFMMDGYARKLSKTMLLVF